MNVANDDITLSLSVRVEAEGGRYRSSCPAMKVASMGRTIDEALTNIQEAVEEKLELWAEAGSVFDHLAAYGVPYVNGRSNELPAHADIPPGVVATTLNQYVKVS
ncbi:MAG: type II toxin-antitoxin system HicB family antitoxin [Chloroflexota bacterium]